MFFYEEILKLICQSGFNAYIVGGAIRDLLNGDNPHDYDIATNADYDQLIEIFENTEYSINTVGKSFGVILIKNSNGEMIEIAQYRKDNYNINNECSIEKVESIHDDLSRRDLTINAMAYCPFTGEIIDPFNGQEDLFNQILRFVGDPDERIAEDPIRILRIARIAAKLNGEIELNSLNAMIKNKDLIKNISPERIRAEIMKSMEYQNASIFINYLQITGILEIIFPTLNKCVYHDHGDHHLEDVYTHMMIVGDSISPKYPMIKLAGYLHDIGKPMSYDPINRTFYGHAEIGADIIVNELKNLRFSNEEIDYISKLIKFHMRELAIETKDKTIRKLLAEFNTAGISYRDYLRLKFADSNGNLKKNQSLIKKIKIGRLIVNTLKSNQTLSIKDLKINGGQIMKLLNIKPGPEIGITIKKLFEMVLENPNLNNYEDLSRLTLEIN